MLVEVQEAAMEAMELRLLVAVAIILRELQTLAAVVVPLTVETVLMAALAT
jgi:hypothetical protein